MPVVLAYAAIAAATVYSGYQQKEENEANAKIYEQQAEDIQTAKDIEARRDERKKRRYSGTLMANLAKSGLGFTGTPVSVLTTGLAEIEMDKQIGQWNYDREKGRALSGASGQRRAGKNAVTSGYISALGTVAQGSSGYYQRNVGTNKKFTYNNTTK